MGDAADFAEPERGHPLEGHAGIAVCVKEELHCETGSGSGYYPENNRDVNSASGSGAEFLSSTAFEESNDLNCDMIEDQACDDGVSSESVFANYSIEDNFDLDQEIVNSTVLSNDVDARFLELQVEYNSVVESHSKLRDQLTEAEVDKLELSHSLTELEEKCVDYSSKCETLETENAELKLKVDQCEARIKELNEQSELQENRIKLLTVDLAKATRCMLTLEKLQQNDDLVSYYTGLPSYGVFNAVLTLVTSQISDTTRSLKPGLCLLMTLMRLRLGLQLEDLAHRFGISTSTASSVFEKWLFYLYVYLEPCINWPDRETLYKTMPEAFKAEFGKSVAVIIDCFELFCNRPGALDSRAMT